MVCSGLGTRSPRWVVSGSSTAGPGLLFARARTGPVPRHERARAVAEQQCGVALGHDSADVDPPPVVPGVIDYSDGAVRQYFPRPERIVRVTVGQEQHPRVFLDHSMQQILDASLTGRRYRHRFRVRAPGPARDSSALIAPKAHKNPTLVLVLLTYQLPHVDHARPRHVAAPRIPSRAAVLPHDHLGPRAVVLHQAIEGVGHVTVTDVPGLGPATHHRPVVPFGPGDHLGVLPRVEVGRTVVGGTLCVPT